MLDGSLGIWFNSSIMVYQLENDVKEATLLIEALMLEILGLPITTLEVRSLLDFGELVV